MLSSTPRQMQPLGMLNRVPRGSEVPRFSPALVPVPFLLSVYPTTIVESSALLSLKYLHLFPPILIVSYA